MRVYTLKLLVLVLVCGLCSHAGQSQNVHLRGTVNDARTRQPITGARVSVVGGLAVQDEETDVNGFFDLSLRSEVLPGKSVRIYVRKEGFETYNEVVAASENVHLQFFLKPSKHKADAGNPPTPLTAHVTSSSALEKLSDLGWSVRPEGKDGKRFGISSGVLPSMSESSKYFRAIKVPLSIEIDYAKTIAGLSQLDGMPNLVYLGLSAGEFHDISELKGLDSLTTLEITQSPVYDLSPLAALKNLRKLMLNEDPVSDITPLQNLTKLTTLGLLDTRVSDLSPIKGLQLESLTLRGSDVSDLSPLVAMISLTDLEIGGKQLPDIGRLKQLPNLKKMNLIEMNQVDLSPLGTLSQVRELWIWGQRVVDISPLTTLRNLSSLSVVSVMSEPTFFRNLASVSQLTNLRKLNLGFVQISDLSFLAGLQNLTELSIGCPANVFDVSPIARLKGLETLDIGGPSIVDISPLLELSHLKKLSIRNTPARADVLTVLEGRGVTVIR